MYINFNNMKIQATDPNYFDIQNNSNNNLVVFFHNSGPRKSFKLIWTYEKTLNTWFFL
jgi:hypothetical protein